MGKKWLIIFALMAIIGLGVGLILSRQKSPPDSSKSLFKDVMSYSDGSAIYSCSKPIRAKLTKIPSQIDGQEAEDYIPVNIDEAKLFCHSTAVIENEGKKKVLQRPEVLALINKYQYKDVGIKALEFKYIQDKQFINRLLPSKKDENIGCIIILETPGEKRVYLENDKLETIEETNYQIFSQNLDRVSPEDKKLFLDNLH
jgi:hypothetical protein